MRNIESSSTRPRETFSGRPDAALRNLNASRLRPPHFAAGAHLSLNFRVARSQAVQVFNRPMHATDKSQQATIIMPKDRFFNRGNPAMTHKNPGPSQMVVGFDEMAWLKSPSCSLPDPFLPADWIEKLQSATEFGRQPGLTVSLRCFPRAADMPWIPQRSCKFLETRLASEVRTCTIMPLADTSGYH